MKRWTRTLVAAALVATMGSPTLAIGPSGPASWATDPGRCTIQGSPTQAGFGLENLRLPDIHTRFAAFAGADARLTLELAEPAQMPVGCLALHHVTHSPQATWRWRASDVAFALPGVLTPSAILAAETFAGSLGDIDHGVSTPDGTELRLGALATPGLLHLALDDPAFDPAVEEDAQLFRVRARATVEGAEMTAWLYEDGVEVALLGTLRMGTATAVYEWSWDAALLGDASGADVELYLTANDEVWIDEVDWLAELPHPAPYVSSPFGALTSQTTGPGGVTLPLAAGKIRQTPQVWWQTPIHHRHWEITIRDGRNQAGYLTLGALYLGPTIHVALQALPALGFVPHGQLAMTTAGGALELRPPEVVRRSFDVSLRTDLETGLGDLAAYYLQSGAAHRPHPVAIFPYAAFGEAHRPILGMVGVVTDAVTMTPKANQIPQQAVIERLTYHEQT